MSSFFVHVAEHAQIHGAVAQIARRFGADDAQQIALLHARILHLAQERGECAPDIVVNALNVIGRHNLPFLSLQLLVDEALDDVAFLDVVELFDLHAAFVTGGDFLNVVLEAAQRSKLALKNDDVVAVDAHAAVALDLAVLHIAAAHGADLGHAERLADLGVADDDFVELRREHAPSWRPRRR